MRIALVNPPWSFEGSIYFGCHEPHLPLEYGYAGALLTAEGHRAEIFDAHLFAWRMDDLASRVRDFRADMTVVTTAPSYLFWRCPPPELRVPRDTLAALSGIGGRKVVVGPHVSTAPRAALLKLGADLGVMGECEEALVEIANGGSEIPGTAVRIGRQIQIHGRPRSARFTDLPPLDWPAEFVLRHHHHHHRFDNRPEDPGAEVEASRGCPYHCTFCAKEDHRDIYRRRNIKTVLVEVDRLIAAGARYVYFIDEIFLPNADLLRGLQQRDVEFGVQTRIDLWKPDMLQLLGDAGCVSAECGVESLTHEGREALEKRCKLTTRELRDRLIVARRHIAFVQANLIETPLDDSGCLEEWRKSLKAEGVCANDPVPLFPYPGSPDYRRLWGMPDDEAWERAVSYYLDRYDTFSDIQDQKPTPLHQLEHTQ